MKRKMKLGDLFFGILMYPLSYNSKTERRLIVYNIFDFNRVKRSVARYITMSKQERKLLSDPLLFCFGDTWSRCEFEFIVCPWGGLSNEDKVVDVGEKVDIFNMYVLPNADYLMELINRVSLSSAQAYLREQRRKYEKN